MSNPKPKPNLKGQFIECCDCFTICPCWITEKADEGHCTGLYAWVFDDDAEIAGESLKGKAVAAASYHGKRRVTQTVLFFDPGLSAIQRAELANVFAGNAGEKFKGLRKLLGDIIAEVTATVAAKGMGANWTIKVESDHQVFADAKGVDRVITGKDAAVAVSDTALDNKMGVDGAVRVQDMARLELAVTALPGGPFVYVGRAGMAGNFKY